MGKGISTGVFERNGNDTISTNGFYGVLGVSLIWGFAVTAVIAHKTAEMQYIPSLLGIIFLGLVVPIIGIIIAIKSDNPFVSFIGYNMVIVPFGIILGPVLNQYSPNVIRNAFGLTAAITFIMALAGIIFPNFFSKIGSALLFALGCLVIVRIAQLFIPELDLSIIDYTAAGIFSLYIGYDMYRANHIPKTIDNAIDVSINLYLDIINLFLTILKIMGKSKD